MNFLSRKALGMLKDVGNIGYAKMKSNLADIDVAVVKATLHDEEPPKEIYVATALAATEEVQSRSHLRNVIETRLSRTSNWMVAIKTLALIHRLIRDCQQPSFSREEEELKHQRFSDAKLIAWMALNFDDRSSQTTIDLSVWIRKYSCYLGQRLHCNRIFSYDIMAENHNKSTSDIENGKLLESLASFRNLLECLLGCTPPQEGPVAKNALVQYALDLLVKECSYVYPAINFCLFKLLDSFLNMPVHNAAQLVNDYRAILQQSDNLSEFYKISCRVLVKHGGHSEYPGPETFMTEMEHNIQNYRHRLDEMEAIRNARTDLNKEILQGFPIEERARSGASDDTVSSNIEASGLSTSNSAHDLRMAALDRSALLDSSWNLEASGYSSSNSNIQEDTAHDLWMAALDRYATIASSSSNYQPAVPEYSYDHDFSTSNSAQDLRMAALDRSALIDSSWNLEASGYSSSNSNIQEDSAQDLWMAALNRNAAIASSSSNYQPAVPEYSYDHAFQLAGNGSWIDPEFMRWGPPNPSSNTHITDEMPSSACSFSEPLSSIVELDQNNMQQLDIYQEGAMDDQQQPMACLHAHNASNELENKPVQD